VLSKKYKGNILIDVIGVWQEIDRSAVPVSGLAYYISPPNGIKDLWIDPIHILTYLIFVLGTCGFFSRFWIEISN
jgi:protein transport protein SEC61 subunit alpha